MCSALARRLAVPVDIAALACFRIVFGVLLLVDVVRAFALGRIERYYVEPAFHFTYLFFEWVEPWPGAGMYWHFAALGLLAALVALGAAYRVAMPLFALGFGYVFLLDQARYLNHYYLIFLTALLMSVLPAHRAFSVDAWLRPRIATDTVSAWTIWTLRTQFEVVYVYAGLVKLNGDWLRLEPMRTWFSERADIPLLGPWLGETWVVALASYGAIALHLVGAPMLLFRRTRPYAAAAYVLFHLLNAVLFQIGVFPWFGILMTAMFFDTDWPRRLLPAFRRRWGKPEPAAPEPARVPRVVLAGLALWFAAQVLVPLRHFVYPGDVSWTEEGHRFAWQMLLREKRCEAIFRVTEPSKGRTWVVDARDHLDERQATAMTSRPDMILQFAHHLKRVWAEARGAADAEVRATVRCSLNGRPAALLVDPDRDLARVERSLRHADWILQLD